jgi:hypothetical protein
VFGGRSKDDILEYADTKGAEQYQERGYPSLQGVALALQVCSKDLLAGLLAAPGRVGLARSRLWTAADRAALQVEDSAPPPSSSSSSSTSPPSSSEHPSLANLLSPGFTAVIDQDGEMRRLPLRLLSSLDEFGRLQLLYTFSDHEGTEPLKYFAQHFYGEDSAAFLALTRTCVDHDIYFGNATESMHDAVDRESFTAMQVSFTPGYEEVAEAAVAAGLIAPLHTKNNRANSKTDMHMFEVCDMETWSLLA